MKTDIKQNCHCCHFYCLSWSAIIAGAIVAIGLSFLFNILGLSLGIAAYTTTAEGTKTLVASGYFSIVAGVMVAMFLGGWVSGYAGQSHCATAKLGVLRGFLSWCLALIIGVFLTAHMGNFIAANQNFLTENEFVAKLGHDVTQWAGPSLQTESQHAKGPAKAPEHTLPNMNQQETKMIVRSLFLTFLLFFAGAVMSAYGGYRGFKSKKIKSEIDTTERN